MNHFAAAVATTIASAAATVTAAAAAAASAVTAAIMTASVVAMAAAVVAAGLFTATFTGAFTDGLLFAASGFLAALLLMAMVTMRTAPISAMAPAGLRARLQTDEDDGHGRQAEGQTKQISLHRNSSSNNGTLTNNHVFFGQSTDAT